MMIKKIAFILILVTLAQPVFARAQEQRDRIGEHVPLGVTHMLPGVSILPAGSFSVGSSFAYGFFDVFELSTDVILDAYGIMNVGMKIPVIAGDDFGLVLHAGYVSQDAKVYQADPNTGTQTVQTQKSTAFSPGATVSYRLLDDFTGHTGFKVVSRSPTIPKESLQKLSGYLHGNEVFQEFTVGLTEYIAVALGVSYDTTYNFAGYGATLHLPVLSIGAHYYPTVDQDQTLILLGIGLAL